MRNRDQRGYVKREHLKAVRKCIFHQESSTQRLDEQTPQLYWDDGLAEFTISRILMDSEPA